MKRNLHLYGLHVGLLVLGIWIVACSPILTTPTTMATPHASAISTAIAMPAVITPTSVPGPTSTWTSVPASSPLPSQPKLQSPTPTPIAGFPVASLPSGQYIVVDNDGQGDALSLEIISMEGHNLGQLASGPSGDAQLSKGGKRLLFIDDSTSPNTISILDLTTGISTTLPLNLQCDSASWAPDGSKLALECDGEIYAFSLSSSTLTHITNWSKHDTTDKWYFPAWSPDGKWIAYYNRLDPRVVKPQAGIYLTDTSCLSDPTTCKEKTQKPIQIWTETIKWSPDSRYLALWFNYQIAIVDLKSSNSHVLEIDGEEATKEFSTFAWSPDGNWIAYSCPNGIFLVSPAGGKPTKVTNREQPIMFWIEVP